MEANLRQDLETMRKKGENSVTPFVDDTAKVISDVQSMKARQERGSQEPLDRDRLLEQANTLGKEYGMELIREEENDRGEETLEEVQQRSIERREGFEEETERLARNQIDAEVNRLKGEQAANEHALRVLLSQKNALAARYSSWSNSIGRDE